MQSVKNNKNLLLKKSFKLKFSLELIHLYLLKEMSEI